MKRILIFGYYGFGNSGDDAMLNSLLQFFDENHSISVLSNQPINLTTTQGYKFIEFSIKNIILAIIFCDIFILGGGTHIEDTGKNFRVVKNTIRLLLIASFVKIMKKKVFYIGIGIGPLTKSWIVGFAIFIINLADLIVTRDNYSYNFIANTTKQKNIHKTLDLSFFLQNINKPSPSKRIILGISILPVYSIYYKDPVKDLKLVDKMVELIRNIHLEISKINIFVVNNVYDYEISVILFNKLRDNFQVELHNYQNNPSELMKIINSCSHFLGMRYHSIIFAMLTNKSIFSINYHIKCKVLAQEYNIPNLDIDLLIGETSLGNNQVIHFKKAKRVLNLDLKAYDLRSLLENNIWD